MTELSRWIENTEEAVRYAEKEEENAFEELLRVSQLVDYRAKASEFNILVRTKAELYANLSMAARYARSYREQVHAAASLIEEMQKSPI